jgi:hypothetical protein
MLTRTSWSPFPATFVVPSQNREWRVTVQYTLQRYVTLPIRDLILVANHARYSRPHFLGVRPSIRSKPITAFLATPHTHLAEVVAEFRFRIHCWSLALNWHITLNPYPFNPSKTVEHPLSYKIKRELMEFPTHVEPPNTHATSIKSVGMQKEKVTADFSVPLKILWLTRNIRR